MFKSYKILIALLICLIFLTACSYDASEYEYNSNEIEKPEPKIEINEASVDFDAETILANTIAAPENIKDIIIYKPGVFSKTDFQVNANKILSELIKFPKLEDSAGKEEMDSYYNVLYSYFAEEYRSPADILDNWDEISFGPDLDDPSNQFKDFFNVEIILDASGSMRAKMGDKTKMDVAKDVIGEFLQKLPQDANVGLRVYGHKGSGSRAHKELSCNSTELAYEIGPYNQSKFSTALRQFEPAGWTSIALALEAAQEDLKDYVAEQNTNIIFLVSDGIETCDGDPVSAAMKIAASNIEPLLHVIGFDVDSEGQKQLAAVAKAAKGTYHDANSEEELEYEMNKTREMAVEWEEWKLEAAEKANLIHSARMMEVMHITNDWSYSNADQMKNMGYALEALKTNGHIGDEVFHYLYGRMNEHFNSVNEMLDQFNWQLMRVNDKNYRSMLKDINKRVKANTEEIEEEKDHPDDDQDKNIWW